MMNTQGRFLIALSLPLALAVGCSSNIVSGGTGDGGGTDDGGSVSGPVQIPGCVGACVVNTSCPSAMGPTTITGTVTIPSGNLPLYNAQVFIPTGLALPDPPQSGATCDRCVATPSMFSTTTDVNGKFTLTNVPSGQNIPLIIRVGKWRRVITIPSITDCTTTALPATDTHLPRNQSEGNIPRIALSTGALDAMECILRKNKLGLDDSEFTNDTGTGRVNLYAGGGGTDRYSSGTLFPSAVAGTANPWWDTAANWQKYDIVMLSCEGQANTYPNNSKSTAARQNLHTYLNLGGRVFASHWHNFWIQQAVQLPGLPTEPPLSSVAQFLLPNSGDYNNDIPGDEATINTNFAKGLALQQWLQNSMKLNAGGKLPINYTRVTLAKQNNNVTPARMNPDPARTLNWLNLTKATGAGGLSAAVANPPSQYFSFYTPLSSPPDQQCGQMVFTDLHISGAPAGQPGDHSAAGTAMAFPKGCTTSGLTPQEAALIFLLFDLTSCVQPVIG